MVMEFWVVVVTSILKMLPRERETESGVELGSLKGDQRRMAFSVSKQCGHHTKPVHVVDREGNYPDTCAFNYLFFCLASSQNYY